MKVDEIVLSTSVEANAVMAGLSDILKQYGIVRVTHLYVLVGLQGTYKDDQMGWSDLSEAKVTRVHDGYKLDLPKPELIDDLKEKK